MPEVVTRLTRQWSHLRLSRSKVGYFYRKASTYTSTYRAKYSEITAIAIREHATNVRSTLSADKSAIVGSIRVRHFSTQNDRQLASTRRDACAKVSKSALRPLYNSWFSDPRQLRQYDIYDCVLHKWQRRSCSCSCSSSSSSSKVSPRSTFIVSQRRAHTHTHTRNEKERARIGIDPALFHACEQEVPCLKSTTETSCNLRFVCLTLIRSHILIWSHTNTPLGKVNPMSRHIGFVLCVMSFCSLVRWSI